MCKYRFNFSCSKQPRALTIASSRLLLTPLACLESGNFSLTPLAALPPPLEIRLRKVVQRFLFRLRLLLSESPFVFFWRGHCCSGGCLVSSKFIRLPFGQIRWPAA
ncbi:hypothetical protein CDAR_307831 [Caerostris darwini]|uniref:Uncharacterized protein n=1 Tax=Caerostris darwini TaxID=1538125 RepID=A0AAV4WII7_9ARAC|nr:hypothetical protein CDAR_307831 [Caerostris darwini]